MTFCKIHFFCNTLVTFSMFTYKLGLCVEFMAWLEMMNEWLESDEEIQNDHMVRLDTKVSHLVMTNKTLLFLREKGVLFKTRKKF